MGKPKRTFKDLPVGAKFIFEKEVYGEFPLVKIFTLITKGPWCKTSDDGYRKYNDLEAPIRRVRSVDAKVIQLMP